MLLEKNEKNYINVQNPIEDDKSRVHQFSQPMSGYIIRNDGNSDLKITVLECTFTVKPREQFSELFTPFTAVEIDTLVKLFHIARMGGGKMLGWSKDYDAGCAVLESDIKVLENMNDAGFWIPLKKEQFNDGVFSNENGKMHIKQRGTYLIMGKVAYKAATTHYGSLWAVIRKNGTSENILVLRRYGRKNPRSLRLWDEPTRYSRVNQKSLRCRNFTRACQQNFRKNHAGSKCMANKAI